MGRYKMNLTEIYGKDSDLVKLAKLLQDWPEDMKVRDVLYCINNNIELECMRIE